MRFIIIVVILGCNNASPTRDIDASVDAVIDGVPITGNPLALTCAATTATYAPAECPPPTGAAGHASFCFRPQWPGVTGVDVYVDRGNNGDWSAPFATLADQGDGTWAVTTALANGTYPYLFRVHGAVDHVVPDGQYLLDQTNPAFVPHPANAPIKRSVSQLTVPQVAASIHHVRGSVVVAGEVQPCFVVRFDVGELRMTGGGVISEHYLANFVESAADGTFDMPVADGETQVNVRYPFDLFATYPDPAVTPAIGMARQAPIVAGSDLALEPTDVGFDSYAQLAPVTGTATLPVDFTWSLAGSSTAVAVIGTNIAGNDPAYISTYGTGTTSTWDGTFGNGMMAKLGTTYYWGSWQKRGSWTSESLLFPIVFH